MVDTFEKFMEKEYYNEIFDALKSYILKNRARLELETNRVPNPQYIELDDFKISNILFSNTPGYEIEFDMIVIADIEIQGWGRYDRESDNVEAWCRISCKGLLHDGLKNFSINGIEPYCKRKFESENRLSKHLVPYVYAKDLDKEAEKFLKKYYPRALESPMRIPVKEVVENMGLNLKILHITKNCNVFGRIFFSDTETVVYDEETEEYKEVTVEAGTMLVDPKVFFMRNIGCVNNTIIHECVHWDRHSKFFELQKLFNKNLNSISCHVVEGERPEEKRNALQWMEWQANALAPKILMPAEMTKRKIEELLIRYHVEFSRLNEADIMQMVLTELSDFFGVSLQAAKLRAVDLGYNQAVGILQYVDGRYLPSYTFKQGALKKNQTFVLGIADAVYEYARNLKLRELVNQNHFLYIDALFCMNDSKYIEENEDGKLCLTSYARSHVDECCLVFEQISRANNRYGISYYRECYLCRDILSDTFTETKYVETPDNQTKEEKAAESKKLLKEAVKIAKIQQELAGGFGATLKYHMKRLKVTVEKLEELSLVGYKTIQTMRNNEAVNKSLRNVVAICIGLHLHPLLSEDLIRKSGNAFKSTEEDFVLQFLVHNHYKASIYECNELLTEYDFPELGTGAQE